MAGDVLSDIGVMNYSWLLLAQRLLHENRVTGMTCLGVTEPMAQALSNLSLEQVRRLARSPQVLCRFHVNDHALLAALSDRGVAMADVPTRAHVLMAGAASELPGQVAREGVRP